MTIDAATQAALAAFAGEDLLATAERLGASYRLKSIDRWYESSDALTAAVRASETSAIGCLLEIAVGARLIPIARAIALAVARTPALHGDENFVLVCLRLLVSIDDEEAVRVAIPLIMRPWSSALVALDGSPCAQKAEVLATFLEQQRPFTLPTPSAQLEPGDTWPLLGRHIADCVATDPATHARLLAAAQYYYAHAATQKARVDAARGLVAFGEVAPMLEFADSELPIYYEEGLKYLVWQRPREAIARYHALLTGDSRRAKMFQDLIEHAYDLSICASHDELHWIVAFLGVGFAEGKYTFGDTTITWLDRASGTWGRSWTIAQRFERDARLSVPKTLGARGVLLLEGTDPANGRVKLYLYEGPAGLASASTLKDVKALLEGKSVPPRAAPQRSAPVEEPAVTPAVDEGAPIVAVASQADGSSQGKVAVAGDEYVGVYIRGELVFEPPQAVAIVLAPERLFSWRVVKRAGQSGIGRADYDWVLEIFTWPDPSFVACHVVQSRDVIAWCWPVRLRCPKRHQYRVATFAARSEDYKAEVHVVVHPDGTFSETLDHAVALALAKGELGGDVVASHVAKSERPPLPPPPRAQPSREDALRAAIRDYTRVIELRDSARADVAVALARRALAHRELSADEDARRDLAQLTPGELDLLPDDLRAALLTERDR